MERERREALVREIEGLKRDRGAVILAHNYQLGEVQDVADMLGDSLELARRAAETDADVIVFCGVRFMAETAAILSPDRTVLQPVEAAGCPMADMADAEGVARLREEHPDAAVVCYVNSTAQVKALSDVCCTSANADRVVRSFPPDREIAFVPDRHLGGHAERLTGRRLIRWPGHCPVHVRILPKDVERARELHPGAEVWAHPECPAEVIEAVDLALSTGGMVRRARETAAPTAVVATEIGLLHRLRKERPDVVFVPATEQAICADMKLTRLEDVRDALAEMRFEVSVPEPIRSRAAAAVRRMLDLG